MSVQIFPVPEPDPNKPTTEYLKGFIGGQIEIQNADEGYLYRGEIKDVRIEGEDYIVDLNWCARARDGEWLHSHPKSWVASSVIYRFQNIGPGMTGGDRVCFSSHIIGETVILFPPDGSKLDLEKVKNER